MPRPRRSPRTHVVIIDILPSGRPMYLGRLPGEHSSQSRGVTRLAVANVYTERGARRLADQWGRAFAVSLKDASGPANPVRTEPIR